VARAIGVCESERAGVIGYPHGKLSDNTKDTLMNRI
jgi:hypothetical protein